MAMKYHHYLLITHVLGSIVAFLSSFWLYNLAEEVLLTPLPSNSTKPGNETNSTEPLVEGYELTEEEKVPLVSSLAATSGNTLFLVGIAMAKFAAEDGVMLIGRSFMARHLPRWFRKYRHRREEENRYTLKMVNYNWLTLMAKDYGLMWRPKKHKEESTPAAAYPSSISTEISLPSMQFRTRKRRLPNFNCDINLQNYCAERKPQ